MRGHPDWSNVILPDTHFGEGLRYDKTHILRHVVLLMQENGNKTLSFDVSQWSMYLIELCNIINI